MRPRETIVYEKHVIDSFKQRKILTMPELKTMLHCSIATVNRRLKEWNTISPIQHFTLHRWKVFLNVLNFFPAHHIGADEFSVEKHMQKSISGCISSPYLFASVFVRHRIPLRIETEELISSVYLRRLPYRHL